MNGLHWADGDIAFLIQGQSAQNALGIPLDCPFPLEKDTPHRIDLQAQPILHTFPDHPLVQAMSPVPKAAGEPIPFLPRDLDAKVILSTLARMSSPVRLPIRSLWSVPNNQIVGLLELTNVQTLVLTDITTADRAKLDRFVEIASTSPRKLVLHGDPNIILSPAVARVAVPAWHIPEVIALPWEAYGAHLLRQHMLRK